MKTMIILLSILTLFNSCKKEESLNNFLPGAWGLNKTELYVDGNLEGESEYEEVTTIYSFENCTSTTNNSCELIISEDGEYASYAYNYLQNENLIILDSNNTYQIELITESELILSKEYGENKSVWSFNKDQ